MIVESAVLALASFKVGLMVTQLAMSTSVELARVTLLSCHSVKEARMP